MEMMRALVLALAILALLALATIRLSKGEHLAPPPASIQNVEVHTLSR
jgi:hypothetical protein